MYLAFLGDLSSPGQTASRMPPPVEEYQQETADHLMSGPDAGQADRVQRDSAQRDASHEDLAPEETRGEAHPIPEIELLLQHCPVLNR